MTALKYSLDGAIRICSQDPLSGTFEAPDDGWGNRVYTANVIKKPAPQQQQRQHQQAPSTGAPAVPATGSFSAPLAGHPAVPRPAVAAHGFPLPNPPALVGFPHPAVTSAAAAAAPPSNNYVHPSVAAALRGLAMQQRAPFPYGPQQ